MAPRLLVHAVPEALTLPIDRAFAAVHGYDDDVFWLDDHAGWSVFGAGIRWSAADPALPALEAWLGNAVTPLPVDESDALDGLAWRPGLVGWLEYGLTAETMGAPVTSAASGGTEADAPAAFLRVDRAVAVAPDGRMLLVAQGEGWDGALGQWRDLVLERLGNSGGADADTDTDTDTDAGAGAGAGAQAEPAPASPPRASDPVWRDDRDAYLAKVRACQESIRRGDAYVLNLTTEVVVDGVRQEPLDVFLRLRALAPTRHGGLIRIGGVGLISSSPESFLELDGRGGVATRPVKGTRPRSSDPLRDRQLRDELAESPKERAENTMIVDLMRNDLARVARPGSVEVTALLEVESVRQVHQLVSTVRARLADGMGVAEVLRAAFPAGSMTGAPKRSAVEILDRLEGRARGVYSGAFGFIGADGRAELAMTIRSIVLEGGGVGGGVARIGVGGGVTALSDPDEEYDEVLLKARAMLEALV
ncbi:anthranilate synthase component I family protein [Herbiconiux solani]|uniref:anthranilate synthase component I family protein n=1 Tax=Herbiconiux solani TaxID=661329 RepID=UPI0008250B28|nr:anthranilate synthase component I family protein [Herbiconiux solani]